MYYFRHITPPYKPHTDFVNADYLESTQFGIATSSQHSKKKLNQINEGKNLIYDKFKGFEFVSPTIFQEEVKHTIHDKLSLIYGEQQKGKSKGKR